jgi:hypothetical protein
VIHVSFTEVNRNVIGIHYAVAAKSRLSDPHTLEQLVVMTEKLDFRLLDMKVANKVYSSCAIPVDAGRSSTSTSFRMEIGYTGNLKPPFTLSAINRGTSLPFRRIYDRLDARGIHSATRTSVGNFRV